MFWERVKDLLEKDKLTINALADVTGVSRATWSSIKNSLTPVKYTTAYTCVNLYI